MSNQSTADMLRGLRLLVQRCFSPKHSPPSLHFEGTCLPDTIVLDQVHLRATLHAQKNPKLASIHAKKCAHTMLDARTDDRRSCQRKLRQMIELNTVRELDHLFQHQRKNIYPQDTLPRTLPNKIKLSQL